MSEASNVALPPPREHVPAVRRLAAVFAAATVPPTAPPGYQLLSPLGRGAMGEVYLARHLPLDRLVAIKFVRPDRLRGGPEMPHRFVTEAQATARLQHPNVIVIHEVGEHAGRPFMALEYADGGSMVARLSAGPMMPNAAARIVATVASAVQHAHDLGVIHRDLKPGNVLLLSSGEVKVGDFGLAGPVGVGGQVGTPSYMAPEQAAGDPVGPATDVWAIGAILYECLSGRPPFRGATAVETLDQVRTLDPVSPRQLMPSVPRDLDTVCLKCLRKRPGERYATAAEVAADLARFLNGEPVRARPVGPVVRLGKWAKRRPLPAALAFLLLLAGLGLVVGGLVYQQQLRRAVERAEANAAEADRERARAEENYRQAAAAVDRFLTRVGDDRLKAVAEMEGVRAELLADALEFYRRLAADPRSADPAVRYEAARAGRRAGDVLVLLGRATEADATYQEAIARFAALAAEHPADTRYRIDEAGAWQQRADQLARAQAADAEAVLDTAAARWGQLAADHPDDPQFAAHMAAVESLRGIWLNLGGRFDRAESSHAAAVAGWQAVLVRRPGDLGFRRQLAVGLHNLATVRSNRGRAADALAAETEAIAVFETVYRDDPNDLDAAGQMSAGLNNLGNHLSNADRHAEAVAALTRSLAIRTQISARHPRYVLWRDGVAESAISLAGACLRAGRWAEATTAGKRAAEVYRGLAADFPGQPEYRFWLAGAVQNTAQGLASAGRKAEAMAALDEAAGVLDALLREKPETAAYWERLAGLALNRGNLDLEAGRPTEAAGWFTRGATAAERALALSPQLRDARTWRVYNLASQGIALGGLANHSGAVRAWDAAVAAADDGLRPQLRHMRLPALLAARAFDRLEPEWDELSATADAEGLVTLARSAARAAVAVDAKQSSADAAQAEAFAVTAVRLLRKARDAVPAADRKKKLGRWVVSFDFLGLWNRADLQEVMNGT